MACDPLQEALSQSISDGDSNKDALKISKFFIDSYLAKILWPLYCLFLLAFFNLKFF